MNEMNVARPWGPDVGEIVDGSLPGAAGDLAYRLYRPASPGPNLLHPLVVYFHGGGWVLGDQTSDDPLCRDLCVRSDTLIVSVNYRHAPEHRFPAALDDGWAAVRWVAEHAEELGGIPGRLAVCGWSAGAGIAAVICQLARDTGWPAIVGQALITPVVDTDQARRSYFDNADGYGLTAPLMRWFFDHYADPEVRDDPRIAPLRAPDLSGLPPRSSSQQSSTRCAMKATRTPKRLRQQRFPSGMCGLEDTRTCRCPWWTWSSPEPRFVPRSPTRYGVLRDRRRDDSQACRAV
ncbi:hypothetical protein NIIDMKKI_45270 [Mycobacterium kansasii]|uniref:Alpha/beta hydrolase fold-3 domain-containing protein n=1 Tax=Mycobacterium kansasii TaxID=1768 RepID=A0A7G1IE60_MYCKA|nr:hypothetical protein NIIDMKKI_45270 [Mycobacterium kansasii]